MIGSALALQLMFCIPTDVLKLFGLERASAHRMASIMDQSTGNGSPRLQKRHARPYPHLWTQLGRLLESRVDLGALRSFLQDVGRAGRG